MKKIRIGIFGGCFNPPHNMHKKIGLDLINQNYVDKVIYVPTGNKYQKNELALAVHRYHMLELMAKNNQNLEVSNYEIKNKLTFTYETLDYFKNKYPNAEIYFICGMDNLNEINTWKNYEYILKNYKLLIINRNTLKINKYVLPYIGNSIIITNIKTTKISSTQIRNILKEKDVSNKYLKNLDKEVLSYIKEKQLYSNRKEETI